MNIPNLGDLPCNFDAATGSVVCSDGSTVQVTDWNTVATSSTTKASGITSKQLMIAGGIIVGFVLLAMATRR